ncbi:MAG: prolyl oligopeptidase family serine peptidase, partial [Planctomycetota bacterium]
EPGTVPTGDEHYYRKVFHHHLGSDWRKDPVVVGDLVKKEESIGVSLTSDHRYVLLSRSVDWGKNDLYFRRAGSDQPFKPIAVGLGSSVSADTYADKLVILTDAGAPRFRIATATIDQPGPEHWQDVVSQQKGVLKDFSIVGGRLLVTVIEDVHSRLFVHDLQGRLIEEVELPGLGTVSDVSGEPDGDEAFFGFESFAYPPANFRYETDTGRLEKLEQVQLDLDLSRYQTRQVWYESKDGTRVPMFVTHVTAIKLDGDNPTVLYGYGGFNIGRYPKFDSRIIPWLDAGGVYVVANIRGGSEFGRQWHEAGRREKKQNVFDDFISAARKLIELRYTNPKRLAIYGGSNGGLLVGACMTQHPELFQAVVCTVPLLDMVRYHDFQIARYWISEYGCAEDPEQFKWLYAYSPYHHVRMGVDYPATLLMTAESDSRVQPMHAYKMAAALQAVSSGTRPILLRVEAKAGHGAGKPLGKRIEEQADLWTFLMWQLGMTEG